MTPLRKGAQTLREDGITSFGVRTLRYLDLWDPLWNTVTSRYPDGTNIFTRDWDLLIVLDACRYDAFLDVVNTVPWIEEYEKVRSVGSMSAEWTLKTFIEEYRDLISDTALVTGNIWTDEILNENRETGKYEDAIDRGFPRWDTVTTEDLSYYEYTRGFINEEDKLHPNSRGSPHILTDRAISVGRNQKFDRMVIHYMLPHKPIIADALDWVLGETSTEQLMAGPAQTRDLHEWEQSYGPVSRGEIAWDRLYDLYVKNLQFALDYVEILLHNVDAEDVIITSDHGESFGEHGIWAHPFGFPMGPVKTVPWAKATATDQETYEPQYKPPEEDPDEQERKQILKDLGYL
jgi:hypothetical protein